MLTKMTEEDWEIVLALFDAAQSERGEPGRDDRKFLEALQYFTVHSITWRAMRRVGNWNSVWKRFWRLSRSGVFEAFLQLLAETSKTAHVVRVFDSTVYARTSPPQEQKGAGKTGAGPFAGWFSSKIHLKTDFDGLPIAFHLTDGEVSDPAALECGLRATSQSRRTINLSEDFDQVADHPGPPSDGWRHPRAPSAIERKMRVKTIGDLLGDLEQFIRLPDPVGHSILRLSP